MLLSIQHEVVDEESEEDDEHDDLQDEACF